MPALSTLTDEFTGSGAPNATRWPTTYGTSVTVTGGRLRLSCDTTFAGCASDTIYTFDRFTADPFPPALNSAPADCYQTLMVKSAGQADGTTVGYYIDRVAGLVYAVNWSGFFDASAVSETYNATNHAWLHCRYTGSAVIWERSATLTGTRTTIRTLNSPPAWITATDCQFYTDTHRDGGTNNNTELGSINPAVVVTGTISTALGALSATAAGRRTVLGAAATTLGGLTATAAGRRTVGGSVSTGLGALTAAAAGTVRRSGVVATTLGALSASAAGTVRRSGSVATTLGGLSAAATGVRTVRGQVSTTLGALTATAVGGDVTVVPGAVSSVLGALTAAASGFPTTLGSVSTVLGGLSATAAGRRTVSALAPASLGALAAAASGRVSRRGSISTVLGGLTATVVVTSGITARPNTGTTSRPSSGITARPFTGVTPRP